MPNTCTHTYTTIDNTMSEDEYNEKVIYNYKTVFTGKDGNKPYESVYPFQYPN